MTDKEQLDEMVDLICLKEETIQSLENELKELKNKNEEETFKLTLEIENYKRNARLVSDKEPDLQQENQIIRLKEYFKNVGIFKIHTFLTYVKGTCH